MKKIYLFISVFILLFSCEINNKQSVIQADLYNISKKNTFKIKFSIVHIDDHFSWLFYEINSLQLVYKNLEEDSLLSCLLKIKIQEKYGGKQRNDTANYLIKDRVNKINEHFVRGKIKIKTSIGVNCLLEIYSMDITSGFKAINTIYVRKENKFSAQNFDVKLADSSLYAPDSYQNYFVKPIGIHFAYGRNNSEKKLEVNYYQTTLGPAALPFSTKADEIFIFKPDSTFQINKSEKYFPLIVEKVGFYHCRADTSNRDGITFYYFKNEFPEIKTYEGMIESARYIMKEEEFNIATASENKKDAVDRFWLSLAGSSDRARILISTYYARVKEANQYFSSYLEGWKSDRGMIYIIFGQPKSIYKNSVSENWVYGNESYSLSTTFIFTKLTNPFTENDFSLERGVNNKSAWYAAVDLWRQGRICSIK